MSKKITFRSENVYPGNISKSSITDIELISGIKNDLVNPTYYNDIRNNLKNRSFWKTMGEVTNTLAKVVAGIATILAFAAGFFNYTILSFIAGCFSTTSLVLVQFSSYSMVQSKQHTDGVNEELSKLGLDNIVDITPDMSTIHKTTTNETAEVAEDVDSRMNNKMDNKMDEDVVIKVDDKAKSNSTPITKSIPDNTSDSEDKTDHTIDI